MAFSSASDQHNSKILDILLLGLTLTNLAIFSLSNSAFAQSNYKPGCPFAEIVPPAKETKIFRHPQLNFSFAIPANYQTISLGNESIQVIDPAGYEEIQCLIKKKISTDNLPASIYVAIEPINPGNYNLVDLVKKQFSVDYITVQTTIANQSAVVYDTEGLELQINTSFLTPDKKHLITITAPYGYQENASGQFIVNGVLQEEILDDIISSFKFE